MSGSDGTDRDADTSRYETVGGVVPGGHAVLSDPAQPEGSAYPGDGPVASGPAATGPAATGPAATGPAATGPASSGPARARRGRGPRNRRPLSRSRRRWRAVFFALALAGIAGLIAWALLGSRLLVVRSVVVTGTHLVPTSEVLAAADIPPDTPLLRVNTSKIAARVAAIRQVRSARVATSWPDKVVITVQEDAGAGGAGRRRRIRPDRPQRRARALGSQPSRRACRCTSRRRRPPRCPATRTSARPPRCWPNCPPGCGPRWPR